MILRIRRSGSGAVLSLTASGVSLAQNARITQTRPRASASFFRLLA